MKAAVVSEVGSPPAYREFTEPEPHEGETRVSVTASALTNFTRFRASGRHYSFTTPPPFVVGIDGVGTDDDGRRVYFLFPRAPFGGMAERTVVPAAQCVPVPAGVDDVTLAAIADPGMSSWVALELRARLTPGETVLVNGATGSAGRMAVQVARHLGAGRVFATGRNRDVLDSLGADEVVVLTDDAADARFRELFEHGVDVVLDYLWGHSAERILAAVRGAVRFVQIGTVTEPVITLPGSVLRAADLRIMGSGIGSVDVEQIMGVMARLMGAAAKFTIATTPLPLSRVGQVWPADTLTPRIVLTVTH